MSKIDTIEDVTGESVSKNDTSHPTHIIPHFNPAALRRLNPRDLKRLYLAFHSGLLNNTDHEANIQHVAAIQYDTSVLDTNCKLIKLFDDWQVARVLRLMHLLRFKPLGHVSEIQGWWTYCLDVWAGRVDLDGKEDCICNGCKCGRAKPNMPKPEEQHEDTAVAMFASFLYKELGGMPQSKGEDDPTHGPQEKAKKK